MKGTLYTSYFAKFKKGIGKKISIALYNPSWLDKALLDEWLINLAPDEKLFNDYKYKGISWDKYTQRYLTRLDFDEKCHKDIQRIKELLDNGQDATVYCYEKSTDNCHRHLLAKIFEDMGYEVKEI